MIPVVRCKNPNARNTSLREYVLQRHSDSPASPSIISGLTGRMPELPCILPDCFVGGNISPIVFFGFRNAGGKRLKCVWRTIGRNCLLFRGHPPNSICQQQHFLSVVHFPYRHLYFFLLPFPSWPVSLL